MYLTVKAGHGRGSRRLHAQFMGGYAMPARYLALAHRFRPGRVLAAIALLAAVQVTAALPVSASERGDGGDEGFVQTNLVSDLSMPGVVPTVTLDTHLHNPWGIVHGPMTPWWVS